MYSPPCRRGEFCSPSLTAQNIYVNYVEFFCKDFSILIYLFICLSISINARIFFILGYNPIIVYFLDQIVSEFGNQKLF